MKASPRLHSGSDAAWAAAVLVIVVCLLSTFTLSRPSSSTSASTGTGGGQASLGPGGSGSGSGAAALPGGNSATNPTGGGSALSGSVVVAGVAGVGGSGGGGRGGAKAGQAGRPGQGTGPAGGGSAAGDSGGDPASGGGQAGGANGSASYDCSKGQNAGASDQGVTNNSINFAATVVRTGIAKSFLADAQYGMQAVINRTNQKGGVCGRLINVHEDDDSWDPGQGEELIQKYISCNCYFGLAVNPSSEGVRNVIDGHLLDDHQFPLVGSDGMLIDQYQDPWVWPVATSTHSIMHIIADEAYSRGARNFAIVYEDKYRFGVEGESAFRGEVGRLQGANLVEDMKIASASEGQSGGYGGNASDFVSACSNSSKDLTKCDFVAILLEPATAHQWVSDGGLGDGTAHPKYGIGAPQPLFVTSFTNDCGAPCNGLRVWTSFTPPIPPFDSQAAVSAYKADIRSQSGAADYDNPEVEGAYQGMLLTVQALQQLGPAPTRVDLQHVLDRTTLDTGLTAAQTFQSGNHFAAVSARAFDAVYNGSNFLNWRVADNGQVFTDQHVQDDIG